MTIYLYNNNSETNKIVKNLTNSVSITGTVKDPTNFLNPEVLIDMGSSSSVYMDRNYAQISEFGRYYFIVDKVIEGNKLMRLKLKVDVLMTYANTIINTETLLDRSEAYPSSYINDNQRPIFNYPMTLTKKFSGSFDAFNFYLTTAG